MSAEKAIYALLTGYEPLRTLVPSASIRPGEIPLNAAMPAIGYQSLKTVEHSPVSTNSTTLAIANIQVTVAAKTYPEQKKILEQVRLACHRHSGTIAGVRVFHIRTESLGPDEQDSEATLFVQTIHFKVQFKQLTQ